VIRQAPEKAAARTTLYFWLGSQENRVVKTTRNETQLPKKVLRLPAFLIYQQADRFGAA